MATVTDFTDQFGRADALNLGANWTGGYTSEDTVGITGGVAQPNTTSVDAYETVNAVSLANDQWAQLTLWNWFVSGNLTQVTLALRAAAAPNVTCYLFEIRSGSSFTSRISSVLNGTKTVLGSENATTWATGDVFYVDAVGTLVRLLRNGVVILSFTDSALASGRAGMGMQAQSSTNTIQISEFDCGHFSGFTLDAGHGYTIFRNELDF